MIRTHALVSIPLAAAVLNLSGCWLNDDKEAPPVTPVFSQSTPALPVNCTPESEEGSCRSITIDGVSRHFLILEPDNWRPDNGLLMVLHGLGDELEWQNEYFRASEVARRTGKLLVMPRGTVLTGFARTGKQVWNASAACCYFDRLVGRPYTPDDVKFIEETINEVVSAYGLNPDSTVLWGYSNGAFMANRFACENSSMVAAVISQSGTMRNETHECKPENPVSHFQIHGTKDQSIAWQGDTTNRDVVGFQSIPGLYTRGYYTGAREVTDRWLKVNGCSTKPQSEQILPEFTTHDGVRYLNDYTTIPETELEVMRDARLKRWTLCRGESAVQSLDIASGTHKPVYDYSRYVPVIEEFIEDYGSRSGRTVEDVADAPHYEINDPSASIVSLSAGGVPGVALVRDNGDQTWFVRVSFAGASGTAVGDMSLLDAEGAVIASVARSELYRSSRYAYHTFEAVTSTPESLRVRYNTTTTTGTIVKGNPPGTFTATVSDGSGELGTLTLQSAANTRILYTFTMPVGRDPSSITSMSIASANKTIMLFPVPTGLPDPDDYQGEFTFTTVVKDGGFSFSTEDGTGKPQLKGYAEDKTDGPFYFEQLVGMASSYTLTVVTSGGTLTAPLSRTQ